MLLVQFWHELLSPRSPDAYQARTLDLPLLMDDMLNVVDVARSESRALHHVKLLHEEFVEHEKTESRLLSKDPALRNSIAQALTASKGGVDLSKLHRLLTIARGRYGDPGKRLSNDAEEIVANDFKFKEKDDLRFRLSTIATHALHRGLGEEALADIDETCLDISPNETLARICSKLNPVKRIFTCAIAISGAVSEVTSVVANNGFPQRKLSDLNKHDPVTNEWLTDHESHYQTVIKVEGLSARQAVEESVERLSGLLNIHNLYLNSAALLVESRALILGESGQAALLEITPSKHFGLLPRHDARGLTADRLKRLGSRLPGRLANALECHSLALSATDPRAAITNLWTALETISGKSSLGIGNHVARRIAPVIALRRVDRITTYLSINCHAMASFMGRIPDRTILPDAVKAISTDDLLESITSAYKNAKLDELYRLSGESPLHCYRLNAAWRQYHNPKNLKEKFAASNQRIQWQLERLYRARNLLVHSGEQAEMTWQLLQHAQNYVSTVLGRVMRDLSENELWDVDASLGYQAQTFEYVCASLGDPRAYDLRHRDLLSNRTNAPSRCVWKEPTATDPGPPQSATAAPVLAPP